MSVSTELNTSSNEDEDDNTPTDEDYEEILQIFLHTRQEITEQVLQRVNDYVCNAAVNEDKNQTIPTG